MAGRFFMFQRNRFTPANNHHVKKTVNFSIFGQNLTTDT